MDGPVVWDEHNRQHIVVDHPERAITTEQVEQVLNDPQQVVGQEVRQGI
jgi:hypothetical protein